LHFTGGEPFLRPDLLSLVRRVKQKGMYCNITTNGTLIHETDAYEVVRSGLDSLNVSIDGPAEIHDVIRGKQGAFARSVAAIRLVQAAKTALGSKTPNVTLATTIVAGNMSRLTELVPLGSDLRAHLGFGYVFYTTEQMQQDTNRALQRTTVAKPENQDIPDELKPVRSEELAREVERIKRLARASGVSVTFGPDLTADEIRMRYHDDAYAFVDKCFYPWYAMRINPYGDVYPCSLQVPMGSVRESSIADIWNGARYVAFRSVLKRRRLFPSCAKCCALSFRAWQSLPRL
jgi:radical SAM protein with 4Fe4S-binding SPASM domain